MRSAHHNSPAMVRWLWGVAFYAALGGTAMASQLIYTPIDPSFGGNPLNGSYMMGIAQQAASQNEPGADLADLDLSGLSQSMEDLTNAIDNLNINANVGASPTSAAASTKLMNTGVGDEASRILSPGLTGMGSYEPTVSGTK